MAELRQTFRPEFLNRIDDIIVFRALTEQDIEEVTRRMLKTVSARMETMGLHLDASDEAVAELAKEALVELRQGPHPDPYYDALERELTQRVNALGVGPQGFGGKTTALSVRIKAAPTHIAGLPVAVNVGCHVTRHASAIL